MGFPSIVAYYSPDAPRRAGLVTHWLAALMMKFLMESAFTSVYPAGRWLAHPAPKLTFPIWLYSPLFSSLSSLPDV